MTIFFAFAIYSSIIMVVACVLRWIVGLNKKIVKLLDAIWFVSMGFTFMALFIDIVLFFTIKTL